MIQSRGVKRYRKRSESVEAIQWDGRNTEEITAFVHAIFDPALYSGKVLPVVTDLSNDLFDALRIDGLWYLASRNVTLYIGDYLVRNWHGVLEVWKREDFEAGYIEA